MRIIRTFIFLAALLCIPHFLFAQSEASSLLWRISGNGLQQPSYLFGTMHLKDRRLFFLGDSLYKSIENTAGFAMEIDPAELMDSLYVQFAQTDSSFLLKNMLEKEEYKKVEKQLSKKLGMPADKITRRKLVEIKESWYTKIHKSDDMATGLDLYLYDIAKKQGKWVGGIEDVSDQLDIRDELGKNIKISEILEEVNLADKRKYLEKMIAIYLKQDLSTLAKLITPATSVDYSLITRNVKMARRMDSLSHIRNTFFEVGAAHLPGDSGVIKLLKNKGFVVEPVFSSSKLAPEAYTFKQVENPWQYFAADDSAYLVEMPGKPSDLKVFGDEFKLKIFTDLSNGMAYMTGFLFSNDADPEKRQHRMIESFSGKGFKKLEEKKIVQHGIDGIELVSIRESIYYRLQVFSTAGKIYMVMLGGEKRENLYAKDAERFFNSFAANEKLEPKTKKWVDYQSADKAFSISLPKMPLIQKTPEGEAVNYSTTSYYALDLQSNSYYIIGVGEVKKGFYINDDSLVFAPKLNYYKEAGAVIEDLRKFEFSGSPAMSFSALMKQDGTDIVCKVIIVSRGNRSYMVAAITEKGKADYPDISRFFRSFTLLPYQQSAWLQHQPPGASYKALTPSSITLRPIDTANLSAEAIILKLAAAKKEVEYVAFDSISATNYNVTVKIPSPYYWTTNDSAFLNDQATEYYNDTSAYFAKNNPGNFDSLLYKKWINNGKINGLELMVKNGSKSYYKKVRILHHGDSAFHLLVVAPYAFLTNENNTHFFEDFRFAKEDAGTTLFINKTKAILDGLQSKDSAEKAAATAALDDATFTAQDLPLLHQAFLIKYPLDTQAYTSITETLLKKITALKDSTTFSFVKNNYTNPLTTDSLKSGMLEMLASQQTTSAVALLKEYVLHNRPVTIAINNIIYELDDSLFLAKQLFPEAATLFNDTLSGAGILSLAVQLIDSNMLSKDLLTQHTKDIQALAAWQVKKMKKDKELYISYTSDVINALGKIDDKESVAMLNEYAKIPDLYVKQKAVLALAGIDKVIPVAELRKLAADKSYRTDTYGELRKINKEKVFPKEFISQAQFAESYLYNNATEEDELDAEQIKFKLLAEKTGTIKGVQSRFYIFKITVNYEGEIKSYPAICGPFSLNKLKPEVPDNTYGTRIYYDENVSAAGLNKLFEQYLKEQDTN